jgi:16S rRNA (cytosine967-C5)-methyltransferase
VTPAARIAAAIEVLADIAERRRPAADALKDWGLGHRFAGSKDRAAIASLVYDALRRRASAAWLLGEETPRAVMLGALRLRRGLDAAALGTLFSGERHAPAPLTEAERHRLATASLEGAPAWVAGDCPEWILPSLEAALGDDLLPELAALAGRAPLDIRANALRTDRETLRRALAHLDPAPTPHAPDGLRLPVGEDGRGPSLQSEPEFLDGLFEIQDEGSQLVSRLAAPRAGETVVDLCAGGGGKTLALAALTGNAGRLVATDGDPRRLAPIHERLRRSGAVAEVRTPRGRLDPLADLDGTADLVLVDAPCTGTGTWRRNPDAKWRLRPGSLSLRVQEQARVLDRAARLVRPGGRVAYVTCSVLPEENDGAVEAALGRHRALRVRPPEAGAVPARTTRHGLQLTPGRTGTDGFYIAHLVRD